MEVITTKIFFFFLPERHSALWELNYITVIDTLELSWVPASAALQSGSRDTAVMWTLQHGLTAPRVSITLHVSSPFRGSVLWCWCWAHAQMRSLQQRRTHCNIRLHTATNRWAFHVILLQNCWIKLYVACWLALYITVSMLNICSVTIINCNRNSYE